MFVSFFSKRIFSASILKRIYQVKKYEDGVKGEKESDEDEGNDENNENLVA